MNAKVKVEITNCLSMYIGQDIQRSYGKRPPCRGSLLY